MKKATALLPEGSVRKMQFLFLVMEIATLANKECREEKKIRIEAPHAH